MTSQAQTISTLDSLFASPPRSDFSRSPFSRGPNYHKEHYIVDRDHYSKTPHLGVDLFAVPGEPLTAKLINDISARTRLINVVSAFANSDFQWCDDGSPSIEADTSEAAISLLNRLPSNAALPKIAPDGEGGLMLVWEGAGDSTIAIVDNWSLHMVKAPGTPHVQYIDDVSFDGETIPLEIAKGIPRK